ncbi:MAG: GIY-YIG nuclease family protein [Candidatus Moranbacteria bacterium]|nr:GIY-YIG nuclease family protein [Candidatus Moranbacteria bacterium]
MKKLSQDKLCVGLPQTPGVYLFKDSSGVVLYVGKATSLRDRVRQYFSGHDSRGERIAQLVSVADRVDVQETDTVMEALILEANLIRQYRPKYNVDGKDDKSFSYFVITKEDFPRVLILRETELFSDGNLDKSSASVPVASFFGPYTSKKHMMIALKILRKIFPFHARREKSEKGCLDRQIGLCPGPYDGGVTREEYCKNIRGIVSMFRGQKRRLLSSLERDMSVFAKKGDFEQAARVRDQVFALRHIRDVALLGRETSLFGRDSSQNVRIEGYDISNISGQHAVGSMVVFENGESKKSDYRKFAIKTVSGSNDFAMMREVLARRFRHDEWPMPDLVLVDGGKGQVGVAEEVLDLYKLKKVGLAGLAKGPTRKKLDVHKSELFPPSDDLLEDVNFLAQVRDESHRFAVSFHRQKRSKGLLSKGGE